MDLKGLADLFVKSGLIVENNGQAGINVVRVIELSKSWTDQIVDTIEGARQARGKKGQRANRSPALSSASGQDVVIPSSSSAAIEGLQDTNINVPATSTTISAIKDKEKIINPDGLHPGNVYIINTKRFSDNSLADRRGSMVDVMRLISVLDKFHMHIESVLDGTLNDIRHLMKRIASHDFGKVSCLMIVIMSHGYEGNIIAAKDGPYSLDRDIMYPILQNQTLVSKLKLVVTQACKGSVDPMQFQVEGPRPTVTPSEILHLHSCVEGYPSYLNPKTGSGFINTLCDNLEEYGFKKDILSIANKVVADVKKKFSDIQIPMIHSNLTKEFVFGHYVPTTAAREWDSNSSSDSECDQMVSATDHK